MRLDRYQKLVRVPCFGHDFIPALDRIRT